MESSDKKYSEKEFAEIIKKAAEIQAESGNLAGEQGLGFEELVSVGAELGISADAIRSASLAIRYTRLTAAIGFWENPQPSLQRKFWMR